MDIIKNGDVLLSYYRIINSKAKKGATSTIMKARHDNWGKDIAIKIADEEFISENRDNFLRECSVWAELPIHPYVIQCHFAGMVGSVPMLFLEWCNGSSVKEMIEDGSLYNGSLEVQQKRIMSIAMQSIAGIEHSHTNNVIHKDIKPANIMVTRKGIAKITDFGSAAAKCNSYTCEYCSPEQLLSQKVTEKTDVFSWAVTCLEMFCGKCSWSNGAEVGNYFNIIIEKAIVDIPPKMKDLLISALSKTPEHRPSSYEIMCALGKDFGDIIKSNKNLRFFRKFHNTEVNSDYLNNKALSLMAVSSDGYDKMMAYWDKAIKITPDHIAANYNRGLILWMNQKISAVEFLDIVDEINDDDPTFMDDALRAVEFCGEYSIDCRDPKTKEIFYPYRYSSDNTAILFHNAKRTKWKVIENETFAFINIYDTEKTLSLKELEKLTGIKWEESRNLKFKYGDYPSIRDFSDYEENELFANACVSPDGRFLVTIPANGFSALGCSRPITDNFRLLQSEMPSSEEIMDKYMKSHSDEIIKSEVTMSKKIISYRSGEKINDDIVVMSKLHDDRNLTLYYVYSYNLDKKLIMEVVPYSFDEEKEILGNRMAALLNISQQLNIYSPFTGIKYKEHLLAFYDADAGTPLEVMAKNGDFRKMDEASFNRFLSETIISTLESMMLFKDEEYTEYTYIHGFISPAMLTYNCDSPEQNYKFVRLQCFVNSEPTGIYETPEQCCGALAESTDIYQWALTILRIISWRPDADKPDKAYLPPENADETTPSQFQEYAQKMDTSFTRANVDFMKKIVKCLEENPKKRPGCEEVLQCFKEANKDIAADLEERYKKFDNEMRLNADYYNNNFLGYISHGEYEKAEGELSAALRAYPRHFAANYNMLAFHVNRGNEEYLKISKLRKKAQKTEKFKMIGASNREHTELFKSIKLSNLKTYDGKRIACKFTDNDRLFASEDGKMLVLEMTASDIYVLINIENGDVSYVSYSFDEIKEHTGYQYWNNMSRPLASVDEFDFSIVKNGLFYGLKNDKDYSEKSKKYGFGNGVITTIKKAYTFFNRITEDKVETFVAGTDNKNIINIYKFGNTRLHYIKSGYFDNDLDISFEDIVDEEFKGFDCEELKKFLPREVFSYLIRRRVGDNRPPYKFGDLIKMSDEEMLKIHPKLKVENVQDIRNAISNAWAEYEAFLNSDDYTVEYINDDDIFPDEDELDQEELDEIAFPKKTLEELIAENDKMRAELLAHIKGQDHVIQDFCNAIFDTQAFLKHSSHNRPLAVFTFAGPPGVGKTFLSESAAKLLKRPYKRFDMTEYAGHLSHEGLIGFESTWNNSQPGILTTFVKENPFSVLVFDEIEKAHARVIQLFFQILESGILTDRYYSTLKDRNTGEYVDPKKGVVSFANTIIIFTTNAGRALYEGEFSDNCAGVNKKTLLNALRSEINPLTNEPFFPSALVSRISIGYPFIFNNLKPHHLTEIIKDSFNQTAQLVKEAHNIELVADDDVILSLLFTNGGKCDARQISASVGPFFRSEIKNAITKTGQYNANRIRFTADIDADSCSNEVYSLFREVKNTNILVYSSEIAAEICERCLDGNFTLYHANNFDNACMIAEKYDINLIMLDIGHRDNNSVMLTTVSAGLTNYSSKSASAWKDGYRLFKFLRSKLPETPIYIAEDSDAPLNRLLLEDFVCEGARGKITLPQNENDSSFANVINSIGKQLYMEKKAHELAYKSYVLAYDTAPMVKDGEIVVELRNFELKFAVDADDASSVLSDMERPDIRFKDVIGAEEAKECLKEFINYIQNPRSYTFNGKTPPKGVLLHGNPGTGKTLLAKAMAGECNVTFLPTNASNFVTSYAGSGPKAIRELFAKAKRYAPSIIFIDEVDTIAKERKGSSNSIAEENTLNALLAEMDGFSTNTKRPVFVIAATNYDTEKNEGSIGKLDDAFMRRFDRTIKIELPDKKERAQLLEMLLGRLNSHNVTSEDIESFAERTAYISPAILTRIFQAALRKVAADEKMTGKHLDDALETEMYGKENKRSEESMLRTARHECGHALLYTLSGHTPAYLTIVARGNFNGYMQFADEHLNESHTDKQMLLEQIRSLLAGRAAEMVYYGDEKGMGAGASSDLARATDIACSMITKYGMDEDFGLAVWNNSVAYESADVRKRVNEILVQEYCEAKRLIKLNKEVFDKLVDALVKENRLTSESISKIFGKKLKK